MPTPSPTPTPTPAWAYGKGKYSFISTINLSPISGSPGTRITMTCTATGLPFPTVELTLTNLSEGGTRTLAESPENWEAYGQCKDTLSFNEPGTYRWSSLTLRSRSEGMRVYYTPDGIVKDHDGNIVETHSLSIPEITISTPPT